MHVLHDWPPATDDHALQPYCLKQNELSIMDDFILVQPSSCSYSRMSTYLEELHECHQRASRMKERARTFVWWPNLDRDIKRLANHPDHYHQLLHCTHGLGQTGCIQDYTSIM